MAGGGASKSSNGPTRVRKRVEVESATAASLKRAKDGSAFARWYVLILFYLLFFFLLFNLHCCNFIHL